MFPLINKGMNTITKTILGVGLLIVVIILSSCETQQGEPVVGTLDRTGKPMQVTVHFYDNTRQVTEMYRKLHNIPRRNPVPEQLGFAMWPEWRNQLGENADKPEGEEYDCEIHTLEPRFVDDGATMTLGHELLHCVYGSYHPKGWTAR